MLIRYNKFDEYTRDRIRALESKGHIGYIRYLMMRRWPWLEINNELMRMGLSWAQEDDLKLYFRIVLFPIIQHHKLDGYYKTYKEGKKIERLSYHHTFQRSEIDRHQFCACLTDMEIEFFFVGEILKFYGTKENIPRHTRTNKPIIVVDGIPEFTEILNHPKRPMIETMLVDGKTPKMISDYLDKHYDIQMAAKDIAFFANAFFRTKRRDLERTIDDMQDEVAKLEESIVKMREADEKTVSIGEKSATIANAKNKIEQLNNTIKRLMGHHSHAAFNVGVLEFAQIREIFADVMIRTHRRFIDLDARTEDEVVALLGTLVNTMSKATDKIMALDEKMSETIKKTVSEEMLEVVMPTLDRVMQEEKEAYQSYQKVLGGELPLGVEEASAENDEKPEILGIDD